MRILFKLKVIGLRQIIRIIVSVYKHGFTLLALLDSVKNTDDKYACIQDDYEQLYYKDLYEQSVAMAYFLNQRQGIGSNSKVIIASANSVAFVKMLFAASGLGADIFLLNHNQKEEYLSHFLAAQKVDLIIGNSEFANNFVTSKIPFLNYNNILVSPATTGLRPVVKRKKGSIIILSSGSKGKPNAEKRKISAIKYLNPLIDIIEKLQLKEYRSVLISVPIFHGYGLAALFMSIFMTKRISITSRFDAQKTLQLLQGEKTDCWIAVPLMIQRVYALPNAKLIWLKSIISGGDILPPSVICLVHKMSNAKIYNMYGTSQTGVCTIATNAHLLSFPNSIGKCIPGIKNKIVDSNGFTVPINTAGILLVKCKWSSDNKKNHYVNTGDIVYKNSEGYYFYKGRQDDLMVIGGENIYPAELEEIIYQNADIEWVKAKINTDDNYITKLHIDIVLHENIDFNRESFLAWMVIRMPKYMIPKSIALLDTAPNTKLMQL